MYLRETAVLKAIHELRRTVHPFLGITYLVCKKHGLPVGEEETVSIDNLTDKHLRKYHRLDPKSDHYFQPFKSATSWVSHRYASTGLQTANTQTFPDVFLHKKRSKTWGFSKDHVNTTRRILDENGLPDRSSVLLLAIWLFREQDLGARPTFNFLVSEFLSEYSLSTEDTRILFETDFSSLALAEEECFSNEPFVTSNLLSLVEPPPDAASGKGRSLETIRIDHSGVANSLQLGFGERLSLITGDNGLGKSFILEFAWKAATGVWANRPILPDMLNRNATPIFEYDIRSDGPASEKVKLEFDYSRFDWVPSGKKNNNGSTPSVEALSIFSRADGSFSIFDPIRNQLTGSLGTKSVNLSSQEVWNGKEGVIEGLIRDWKTWEHYDDPRTFDRFKAVLRRLSPDDLGKLEPGRSIRIPGDPREIPTIQHQYGTVPIIHASSGVQRVLLLSYLVIWAWQEHELAADQLSKEPLRRLIILIDELEAHLHPKWQRIVLPALMSIGDLLSGELTIQTIAATHSPMILASLEPAFQTNKDVLYHLHAEKGVVKLDELPFVKYGDATGWLTSPVFGLRHARSREAEKAIEKAKELQLMDSPEKSEVSQVTEDLRRYLSSDDSFWPRWIFFAESHGVQL